MHDPFLTGSYNVEELDEALERQAAEDAQRELDEAFERARHNLNEHVQPDSITVLESGSAPRNKLQVRHVPGRDITQLGYQARQRVNVPAVPHWHGARKLMHGDDSGTRYWTKVSPDVGS